MSQPESKSRSMSAKESPDNGRGQTVRSVEYGLRVLRTLGEMGGAAPLTALAARLGQQPGKIHRYLASLREAGFVVQLESGRYALGPEAILIGLAAMRQSDIFTAAASDLVELSTVHDVTTLLAVLGDAGPTIMRWEEPLKPVTVNVRVGSVLPILWSATGRVFGAFESNSLIDALIKAELRNATPAQRELLVNRKAADALFATVRSDGCAAIRDVLLAGISAVAAPVFDFNGHVCAVITALSTSGQIDPDPGGELAADLKRRAAAVSRRMGHGTAPGADG